MSSIQIDDLAAAIMEDLQAYNAEVSEALKESVKESSKETAEEIKENAPKDSGKYRKSWKSRVDYESSTDIRTVVYNSSKPQLAHLLEYGHAKSGGGRVGGIPHIRPADEKLESKLEGKIKVKLR